MLKRLEKPVGYTPRCNVWWGLRESRLGTIRPMFAKFGTSMTYSILIYEFNGHLANLLAIVHPCLEPNHRCPTWGPELTQPLAAMGRSPPPKCPGGVHRKPRPTSGTESRLKVGGNLTRKQTDEWSQEGQWRPPTRRHTIQLEETRVEPL